MGGSARLARTGPKGLTVLASHGNNITHYNEIMGRNTKYPYHQWTDGQWHDVAPSDYQKTITTLRATLHQYAKAHGYTLMTLRLPNGILTFRFRRVND